MRIKISGEILSKPESKKAIFTHSIYSMLLNRLPNDLAKEAHSKHVSKFTFSALVLNYANDNFSFYFSSTEENCLYLADTFENENMFRLDNYHLGVSSIDVMPELEEKDSYLFRGKLLIYDRSKTLIQGRKEQETRLKISAKVKLRKVGLPEDLEFEIFDSKETETLYRRKRCTEEKHAIIDGFYTLFRVKGDFESIQYLHDVGFGQNCATGNGLVWEVGL